MQVENSIPELRGGDYDGVNSSEWRAAAEERIKRLRTGEFVVTAVDAAGHPVPACSVEILQKRSSFRFGTEISAQSILGNDPTSVRLREELLQRFNTITLGNELPVVSPFAPRSG
jgi:hypothetical protein